jgi:fructokinase
MHNVSPVLVGGEALFDLISSNPGAGLGGTKAFEKRAGGSPFNIAVGVRRLGTPVAFVGKFGEDQFGEALVQFLRNEQIDVDLIVREPGTKTTLAFVAVDSAGKVDFRFYRDNAADT